MARFFLKKFMTRKFRIAEMIDKCSKYLVMSCKYVDVYSGWYMGFLYGLEIMSMMRN